MCGEEATPTSSSLGKGPVTRVFKGEEDFPFSFSGEGIPAL